MAVLTRQQIEAIGFACVGKNVFISDKASFYGVNRICIGSNVRIDDFCVVSAGEGGVEIGNNIHIAVYTSLIGAGPIRIDDFCNLSSRVSVYSSSDDYSGEFMSNPTIPDEFKSVTNAPVHFCKHVIIGSGSVILPGVTLEEGVAIGALSLVTKDCKAFGIYAGSPVRFIKDRSRNLLELEVQFIQKQQQGCYS